MREPSLDAAASTLLEQRVRAAFGELQWNWMAACAERDAAIQRLADVTAERDQLKAQQHAAVPTES